MSVCILVLCVCNMYDEVHTTTRYIYVRGERQICQNLGTCYFYGPEKQIR